MTFSKSNLNLLPESLFTELTADQAQMLEGGKRINILLVRCIQAGGGSDNLSFDINRERQNFRRFMRTDSVANVGIGVNFNGTANVVLFDNHSLVRRPVGSFSASSNGQQTQRVSAGGSTYDVTYQVTN
ncbi:MULTISPECIES: hypothetical protein [Chamaesiphon]|uniref:Uncharacterized protein n=1 Tax=Chamaesiphon minutus (strain ATCC 27169 / PCC 6605) TaxID=1173020 RepID=K9UFC3_CHAP6|nr:hypothetical protein [Chamaesiphon minutus]AFY93338.1 hypothetical protein Cha6605_2255 [Chamaesiphon minutus PCC 6605]